MAEWGQLRGKQGGNVRFLHTRVRMPVAHAPAANLKFEIENLALIRMAYGDIAAKAASRHLATLLADFLGDKGKVLAGDGGGCLALLSEPDLPPGDLPVNWIDSFCDIVALGPLIVGGDAIHLFVTGGWDVPQCEAPKGATLARFQGQAVGQGDLWAARYRADMALVASTIAALECGLECDPKVVSPFQLVMGWQAVRRVSGEARADGDVLYYQARPALIDRDGRRREFTDLRVVLERLGFATLVDGALIDRVLLELENDPDITLGIGISAHSAGDAGWWQGVATRIQLEPGMACRLIVEITETAAIPDISAAANLLRRMRRLGCRFAIDNFGLGFASIRELIALMPDIVRLDPFFLGTSAPGSLRHLAGLAQSLVPTVVADGVESQNQSEQASKAGVIWQQGAFLGGPSLTRPWLFGERSCLSGLLPASERLQ